jgi:transcriptional regulator with XRE-family HTH domain
VAKSKSFSKVYGERVLAARLKSGKSREELAKEIELHPKSLARIERGEAEPRDDTKEALAKALDDRSLKPGDESRQRENAVEYTARHYGATSDQVRDAASIMFRAASERCLADWRRDVEEARGAIIILNKLARRWPHFRMLVAEDAHELLDKDLEAIGRRDVFGRHIDWDRLLAPEDQFGASNWPLAAWLIWSEQSASIHMSRYFDENEPGKPTPLFWPSTSMSPCDHFIDEATSRKFDEKGASPHDLMRGSLSFQEVDADKLELPPGRNKYL